MSLPDDEPVLSREGSALLPETPSAVPDAPTISPLIAHLSNFLTDCHLDLLARLENRLARVGITTVRQLGALRESVDGEPDPVARELFSDIWKQVLDSFKSQQRLQRAQFVQAANAARQNGLAVGLAPSAPPVAPLPSPPEPHQQQELPPTAPVQVSLTRDQFAQRLHQAFLSTEVWQVPEHIWTAFFAARGASPLVKDDVVLEAADGKATVKCVLCPTSCTLHWKNNCWNLSSLLSHLHNKHAAATGTKRAAPTSQLDAYWQNVRQRTTSASLSPSSAAPTAPPAAPAPAPAPAPATAPAQALSAPPAAQPKCCS